VNSWEDDLVLMPDATVVVILDTSVPTPPLDEGTMKRLCVLSDAATLLNAPVFRARYRNKTGGVTRLANLLPSASVMHDFDARTADWSSTWLGQCIAETGRTHMVICGMWLEEAITLAALRTLSVGYDIYVPVDATYAHDPVLAPFAHMRLVQAGAVPTSAAQVIREWAALSNSEAIADSLLASLT
jgi:hypothetical protein